MKVIAVRTKLLDLDESMLHEEGRSENVQGTRLVTGVGVFDEQERLMPLMSQFLSEKLDSRRFSIQTAFTYGRNLGYCQSFLASRSELSAWQMDDKFLHVGRPLLVSFVSQMQRNELGSKTVRNRDATVQSFVSNFLCVARDDRPAFRIDDPYLVGGISPAPKSTLVKSCTLPDLQALIEATPYERERCLLQFIFDAGVRRSEVPRIMRSAIDDAFNLARVLSSPDQESMSVPSAYCLLHINGSKGTGDQGKERMSIVSPATLERIKRYHSSPLYRRQIRKFPKGQIPAFLNSDGDAYTANAVSALLRRVSERAVRNLRLAKVISPHKLRHGYAYTLLNSRDLGEDHLERLVMVQKSLGHADIKTSEKYTQIPANLLNSICGANPDAASKAVEMQALFMSTRLQIDAKAKK